MEPTISKSTANIHKSITLINEIRFYFLVMIAVCFSINISAQQNKIYEPSEEVFSNPERGIYSYTQSWNGSGILTASQLSYIKAKNHSLIYRIHYIPAFRDTTLPLYYLAFLDNDFQVMRENGIKCILRFAYSNNIGVEDASLTRILGHLDQLKETLQNNYDVIAFMQAGFIGAWGEWHSSQNNLDRLSSRKSILLKILEVLPKERMVQLRTPSYKQTIFGSYSPTDSGDAFNQSNFSRTGHHNDCFLAAADDWGTYVDTTAEKLYLSKDTRFVPIGGETCNPSSFSECANAIYQMKRLHWTYINNDYHKTIINGWKTYGCYDEIAKNLGYRFELIDGTYSDSVKPGGGINITVRLRNVGYASLYNERSVEFILRNDTDTFFVKLPLDPRFWQSGDSTEIKYNIGIPSFISSGNYELLLNMPDISATLKYKPDYSIRFANSGLWETVTGYNKLNAFINIDPAVQMPDYSGNLFFEKLSIPSNVKETGMKDADYKLNIENYPNPFNSQTKIIYSIHNNSKVSLKMYDTLGRHISTLVDDFQQRGQYTVDYDAKDYSSGIYYFVLTSDANLVTHKAILLK